MKEKCCGIDHSRTALTLNTIAEDTRLRVICLLKEGPLCVCQLQAALSMPHNLLLHHLKKLVKAGLVTSVKKNRFSYYSIKEKEWKMFLKELDVLFRKNKKARSNDKVVC